MTRYRPIVLALLAACVCTGAAAQWKWRDRSGVLHYSDVAPPQGTPAKDILERPGGAAPRSVAAAPAPSSTPATTAGPVPRGVDPELEARRRKAEAEKAEKEAQEAAARRADEERVALQRADNCRRARSTLKSLEDGMRMARTNDKGEREILDDRMRAEETARVREIIASECK